MPRWQPRPCATVALSPRERAVARELARHESIAALAAALNVSPNTVKSQLRSVYRKLGVTSRAGAIRALAGWDGVGDPSPVAASAPMP
ncbi:helix-turn-helix transcriptional regulator [Microbacterium schleiferi]|uniref:Helix-turn-helix transcriptional regulator n=1 Tax=Microbacterium schleiferi TaxID=69362 RepID=A0A7S8N032_9MICO|nr:helix-turn-helix transcriptional regulator [Microbacterium schleiferi]QPE05908.1 helix-turn-helix transcriptional regulator [Microbacterium schleiferi]